MTTKEKHYKYPLVNGKKIHFRREQMFLWGTILGLLGAGFFAGIYWWFLQQKYGNVSAKLWWDNGMGIFHSRSWVFYRHGERDRLEPAGATLGILAFLFGVRQNSKAKLHSPLFLAVTGVLLLAFAAAAAAAETWLIYFEAPAVNHHHPLLTWQTTVLSLVLGIILGKILHYGWMPAAATIQYHLLEGPLSKGRTPIWVRYPLAPPTLRERFCDLQEKLKDPQNKLTIRKMQEERGANRSKWFAIALSFGILLFFFLAITGLAAKFGGPSGHLLPGMVS